MTKEHKKIKEEADLEKDITKDDSEQVEIEMPNELESLKQEAQKNLDGWQRSQAEFENYKKRTAESQREMLKYATQNIVLEILPVIDNFHASTDHIPEDQKDNPWVTGIMYIQKQLEDVLTENGVQEIEVKVGDRFDPIFHEAIEDKEYVDCKEGEVENEYQNKIKKVLTKGYKIGEKVIRAVRVVVE